VQHPTCSLACRDALKHGRGRSVGSLVLRDGYVNVRLGQAHRLANSEGYAPAQLVVAERLLGRPLRGDERVRRLAFYREDNRPESLFVQDVEGPKALVPLALQERLRRGDGSIAPCAHPQCERTVDLASRRGRLSGTCSVECSRELASVPEPVRPRGALGR